MTAAVRAQLAAHGAKLPKEPLNLAPVTTTRKQRGDTAAAGNGEPVAPENEPVVVIGKSKQHYIGPYQLAVANGTHYPGRSRIVVVGPASDELTAALVAALKQFTKTV